MLNLNGQKKSVLEQDGHLLIMGGPGSGKTTTALLKAKAIIENNMLENEQHVLFLSFARATVARIEEQASTVAAKSVNKYLEINTYHSFIWNILKSHGYLLNKKRLKILSPHDAASHMATIEDGNKKDEIKRLFEEKGIIHFDYFADLCEQLLSSSSTLLKLFSSKYPFIVLDEFQDTNSSEWALIKLLGQKSTLIALADPEQRIYDFRGADPKRIAEYTDHFSPISFDFENENNRSEGTDIVIFGNDLLRRKNKGNVYENVKIKKYKYKQIEYDLKSTLIDAYKRVKSKKDWTIAILVPSNNLMINVSDILSKQQKTGTGNLPIIQHEVSIESAGPSLAGVLIASLMELGSTKICKKELILEKLCDHIKGHRGSKPPTAEDLKIVEAINNYLKTDKIIGKNRLQIINDCVSICSKLNYLLFSGDVISDWQQVIRIVSRCESSYFKQVVSDVKYLKLLRKGSQLHSALNSLWKSNGSYYGATNEIANALITEHFAMTATKLCGVYVMTIHKSKGKEFDEVIIYEGLYSGKFVYASDKIAQACINLRVAVTRARNNVTILTPFVKPSILL